MKNFREKQGGSSVMSIETGFSCNAYCAFCPQISYRREVGHARVNAAQLQEIFRGMAQAIPPA